MRANLNRAFSLALVLVFAWALFEAQGFRAQARLFPVAIGVAGLALALLHLALEFRRAGASVGVGDGMPAGAAALAPDGGALADEVPPAVLRRRTYAILGWVLGFALAIWLLGFPLAVPLMTLAYLKLGAGESARVSVVYAVLAGVVFYGLFVELVRLPFEPGVLLDLLPL
jgi:hypothetical protein